jgi:Ni/Fe-hydrogenase subunit HybB-like protein
VIAWSAPAPDRDDAPASPRRTPWIDGDPSLRDITDDVMRPLMTRPGAAWWWCFLVAASALAIGAAAVTYEVTTGIGTWGLNKTVGWAFDITNFVFWVGIGHAGTLISAILLLLRQQWRTAISRSAEAMTIFAVMCAAMFPLIHMGRPWLAFWVLPYPNSRGPLWVNFRSPLLWDVFAINTYLTISLVFWYVGMIPDFATLRDRAQSPLRRFAYSVLSLGWDGSARTWSRYETASTLLAGLATPLVISVHTIVSMDFATSVLPGWHATIFPPYFVAGAVFSGFAMVLTLLIIVRAVMQLERYITPRHLDAMAKIMLLTGSIVGLAYATEFYNAWYGHNIYERAVFLNRVTGPYAWGFAIMAGCNALAPQLLWVRRIRRSVPALFALSIVVNVGMWFERFIIIVTSLHRSFLPSTWTMYQPSVIEVATLVGSFGLFFTCFLLFVRLLPMIAMWEVKALAGHHTGARR